MLTLDELETGLEQAGPPPADGGRLEMIVRRPDVDQRETLEQAELSVADGLSGDNWKARGSRSTPDGRANPEKQITLMNSRIIRLLAGDPQRWPLAGDQLFVDLDLSEANLPAGTRLAIGDALIEITASPHTGCAKFAERFGADALRFVNAPEVRHLHRRGVNARVIRPGVIRKGDLVQKI